MKHSIAFVTYGASQVAKGSRVLAAGALAVLLFLWAGPSLAAASGEILALSGTATIENGGRQRTVAIGDPVQSGDTINVPQDSKARLRMDDGSIITIAPGSKMTIDKYDVGGNGSRQTAELTMSAGLMRAVVSVGGGTPNFEVKTATGVASVRGTELYIDAQSDNTQVYVVTGSVALANAAGSNPVTIPQMSASSVEAHKDPSPIRPVTPLELQMLAQRTGFGLGLCQCIVAKNEVVAACRPTSDACQTVCGGTSYSFVPGASESCGRP
jgi:hypothetical protein